MLECQELPLEPLSCTLLQKSSVGGPLALIKTGDMIELDVEQRRLHLDVSDDVLQIRRDELVLEDPTYVRGYYRLYIDSVTQADEGVDFFIPRW